ncbi:MAG: sugar phosphate isomerase/epimerase [Treponema sp.]|nr:sugar phosphate isomerase/epimerase [Treponema sp.]
MELGVFTILFNDLPPEECFTKAAELGLKAVELGCGGYSRSRHAPLRQLLDEPESLNRLRLLLEERGLRISGLGAQGNPVHPDPEQAARYRKDILDTLRLAELLEVDTLLLLSGCPGGGPGDRTPNWITCPWPEDYSRALAYQWNDVLLPYWRKTAELALEHGVTKLAVEPHPGFCVYNTETLLKLKNLAHPNIGANFDPSHLFWQGIDPAAAIRAMGGCIYHVHAKDCFINTGLQRLNGVLDAKPYREFSGRAWNFRTVGYGHDAHVWKVMISTLAETGYNGVISIEHEDALMSREEGLEKAVSLLSKIIIRHKNEVKWWELREEG